VRGTHLVATLVALALALATASCGGEDSQEASAPEAGTSTAAQTDPPSEPSNGPDRSQSGDVAKGSGGSGVADAERAAPSERTPEQGNGKAEAPEDSPAGSGNQESKRKPKTAAEGVANLSPSERRALHKDLYEQGRTLCYAYGPKELAKSFNLTGSNPETIAAQYARIYEAAAPTLILPYQQGCMAGFRKFARNPPKR
jgi:hypothetical protein